jgi:acetolactate synthase-1/2/3 large subunit
MARIRLKVYEAIARSIIDEKIEAVFALVGNANMEMMATIATAADGPAIVNARIEGTAVGMAEGYSRSSGKLGVAVITSGPALTNATNALTSAARANTAMLLITGHPASRTNHQHLNQEALAELVGAAYFVVSSVDTALEVVHDAFYAARTQHRPVILDLSRDIQSKDLNWDYSYDPSYLDLQPAYPMPPAPEAIEAALQLIGSSERPVIVAGKGAYDSNCRADIMALAEELGAVLCTSLHVKNWFAGEPYNLGVAGLFSWQHSAEILGEADCVIGIGASLNHYTTEGGYLFPSAQFVQVDIRDEILIGTGKRADVYVRGDANATTKLLLEQVKARNLGGTRFRTQDVLERITEGAKNTDPAEFDIEPGRADARRVLNVVDAGLPDECGIVVGTAHNWGLSNMELKRYRDPQLYSHAFGSIGIAFPLCLGAAVAHPGRPFLHVEGDGSMMMTVHGFDTLARYQLPVFVVVLNDSAFSAEAHQLIAKGLAPDVAYLSDVDFAAVAQAFGCRTAIVRNEADMAAAVEQFTAAPGPFVVDVRASREVVSVAVRRLHYGVHA